MGEGPELVLGGFSGGVVFVREVEALDCVACRAGVRWWCRGGDGEEDWEDEMGELNARGVERDAREEEEKGAAQGRNSI